MKEYTARLEDDGTLDTVIGVFYGDKRIGECRFNDVERLPNGGITPSELSRILTEAIEEAWEVLG